MTAAAKKAVVRHAKKVAKKHGIPKEELRDAPFNVIFVNPITRRDWWLGMFSAALIGAIVGTMTLAALIIYVYPMHL